MNDSKEKILEELFDKYFFLNFLIPSFERIATYKVNRALNDELYKVRLIDNVENYINEKVNEDSENFKKYFASYEAKFGAMQAFTFFNNLLDVSDNAKSEIIDYLSSTEKYFKLYDNLLAGKNTSDESFDYNFVKNSLLSSTLEIYDLTKNVYKSDASDEILLSDDNLNMYFQEISGISILTPEEEKEAFTKLRNGDQSMRDYIIEHNLRLSASIAKKYQGKLNVMSLLDLIQSGNIGLIDAVDRFDVEKGNKFSTYAVWWIRQRIIRAIDDEDRTIRIPVHIAEDYKRINQFINRFITEYDREPTIDEIADNFPKLDSERIKNVLDIFQNVGYTISLDLKVGEDDDATLGDFIPSNSIDDPIVVAELNSMKSSNDRYLKILNDRERSTIEYRYGRVDGEFHTLGYVGNVFGITRERVRQIESKAIFRMNKARLADEQFHEQKRVNYIPDFRYKYEMLNNRKDLLKLFMDNNMKLNYYSKSDGLFNIECLLCGYKFITTADEFLVNCKCPKCQSLKKSLNSQKEDSKLDKLRKNVERASKGLTKIINASSNENSVVAKCMVCDKEWRVTPGVLLTKCECPSCRDAKNKVKTKLKGIIYNDFLDTLTNKKIDVESYNGYNYLANLKCNECGFVWQAKSNTFILNPTCPKCKFETNLKYDYHKLNDREKGALKRVNDKTNGTISIQEFFNNSTTALVKCHRCDKTWQSNLKNISSLPVCPTCRVIARDNIVELYERKLNENYTYKTGNDMKLKDFINNQIHMIEKTSLYNDIKHVYGSELSLIALIRISIDTETLSTSCLADFFNLDRFYVAKLSKNILGIIKDRALNNLNHELELMDQKNNFQRKKYKFD